MENIVQMFPKNQVVKLHGTALAKLNDDIHKRDGHRCIYCGAPVDPGEKFHHEPCGAGRKSDEIDKGCTLCYKCHHKRHHGPDAAKVKRRCEEYLREVRNGKSIPDTC